MVTFSWVAVAVIGALPYLFSGVVREPAEALFESMSGFTTTGSTILTDIEGVLPGILLWRSLTQWLGGMGFIVLGVAVLPYLGVGGMQLFRLEAPGPTTDRLRPRIRETARLLWVVYLALTGLLVALFRFGGMSGFDALNHALTTMPTGGFSTRNDSMAAFSAYDPVGHDRLHVPRRHQLHPALPGDLTRTARLLAGHGVAALRGDRPHRHPAGHDPHRGQRSGGGTARARRHVPGGLHRHHHGIRNRRLRALDARRPDRPLPPLLPGRMAGSTAGGMKMIRVLLVLKQAWLEVRKQLHPRAVIVPKVGGKPIQEHIMMNVLGFILIYMMLFGVGAFLMSTLGLSLPAAAGAAATAISNVGPGLAELGPAENFSAVPWQGHLILTFLMMVGRLEIYTVVLLFHPGLWRR
jgi:trk system potassium uptake protein